MLWTVWGARESVEPRVRRRVWSDGYNAFKCGAVAAAGWRCRAAGLGWDSFGSDVAALAGRRIAAYPGGSSRLGAG